MKDSSPKNQYVNGATTRDNRCYKPILNHLQTEYQFFSSLERVRHDGGINDHRRRRYQDEYYLKYW